MQSRFLVLLAVLAASVGLGASLSIAQDAEPRPFTTITADPSGSSVASGPIGALRRHPLRDDTVPAHLVDGLQLADGTARLDAARKVRAGTSSEGWLMPGADEALCHVRNGFANCPDRREIEQRGAAPALNMRGGVFVLDGIASDAVDRVEVTFEDGTTSTLVVSENVFSVASRKAPGSVAWQGPAGPERADFSEFVGTIRELQRTAPRRSS